MSERLKPSLFSRELIMDKVVSKAILRILTSGARVEGRENIPERKPFLVAFNHMGWIEVLALLKTFYPSWVHWMGKREVCDHRIFGLIPRALSVIPVKRGEVDREAIRLCVNVLKEGKILGIAPEGTRGRGEKFGKLKKAKHGAILIAWQAKAPIIPTGIWGTEKAFPLVDQRGLKLKDFAEFERTRIFVKIGQPFEEHLDESLRKLEKLDKETREILTTNLMLEIRDMLPREYHGYYAEMERQAL